MAFTQKSYIASTTGSTWTDLVTGPATVTSLTLASKSVGGSMVSVQLKKSGGSSAYIVPSDNLPYGASARLRLPSIVLETGDKLQVQSSAGVDWTASGVEVSA